MADVPYAALAGLGGQLLTGGIGELLAGLDEGEQERLLQQALNEYGQIDLPKLERVVAEQLGPSRHDSIQTDPALRQAQLAALQALQDEARSGGMTLQDRATYSEAQNRAARAASGMRGRIREDLEARGMGGSGTETAMQLDAAQRQAQMAGEGALRTAADSRQRALDAMMQGGRLAGQMREQDFGEKGRAAEAADAIARYNAESRSRAGLHNAGLGQQGFDNQLRKAAGKNGLLGSRAALKGQRAQGKRNFYGQVGGVLGQAGADTQSYMDADENPWKKGGF